MLVTVPTLYNKCRASQDIMIVVLIFWLKRLQLHLSLKAFNVAEGSTYFSQCPLLYPSQEFK